MTQGNNLFSRAKYNYLNAIDSYERSKKDDKTKAAGYSTTAFMLQQSIEFYLKGILKFLSVKYPGKHDLFIFVNLLHDNCDLPKELDYKLNLLLEEISEKADRYNEWESRARYDDNYTPSAYDIDDAFSLIESIIDFVENDLLIENE